MSGILNPLYTAVSWVIITFHDLLSFTNNEDLQWSIGIISLVILIRIILIPLFVKQIKSQRALTALQPHMKAIQKKYKDDRQKQSEEMMKLYKEHKTNPLASCLANPKIMSNITTDDFPSPIFILASNLLA